MDDIEKLLGLQHLVKPLMETVSDKTKECVDDFIDHPSLPIFEHDQNIDVLFTQWIGKPKPVETVVEEEPKKEEPKKVEPIFSDKQQDLLKRWKEALGLNLGLTMGAVPANMDGAGVREEKCSAIVKKLSKRDPSKWSPIDWKLAERYVNKSMLRRASPWDMTEKTPGKIFSMKPLMLGAPTESVHKSLSKALVEMKFLDAIFKKAMTVGHADAEKEIGKEQIHKRIDDIVAKTFKEFGVKPSSPRKSEDKDMVCVDYKVTINKEKYAIHTYFFRETKNFMFTIWDHEENRLLLTVCEGYLRQYYYLVGVGKERIKAWMETVHGTSKSGKDSR